MSAILEVHIASKTYLTDSGKLAALKDVQLEVGNGEFLCIVGPSGCGKTTLLNILAGLDLNYEGRVLYHGHRITWCTPRKLLIFQDLGLFPWLSVEQNIGFGLKMKNLSEEKQEEVVGKYLEMMNLVKFRNSYMHELSGGMRQRVALARTLATDPEVILMDEPFASLDAQTRDKLHGELQKVWQLTKKTIVFVTHNVREAVCLGDRVLVFSASPSHVKASFTIDLPRPRQIESHGLIEKVRPILEELKTEIEKVNE